MDIYTETFPTSYMWTVFKTYNCNQRQKSSAKLLTIPQLTGALQTSHKFGFSVSFPQNSDKFCSVLGKWNANKTLFTSRWPKD